MEIDSENVAEIEKYAFLLGSAIKNEDTEQFFSIYDSILPRDIPDNQLEEIKERARKVADLSEEEFSYLVSRARHFSLAPAGTAMTCRREPNRQKWTRPGKVEDSEDDDGIGSHTFSHTTGGKSDTSSLYSTARVSETRKFDDDSGVCNSSKATNSLSSWSDQDGSEDEGHGASFDYFHTPQIKIRSGCGLSLDYDEAHEVKSDHSSQDINSPRSDISEGIEMTTFSSGKMPADDDDDEFNFRREVNYQDDFNTSGESDDESTKRKYYNLGYRPLSRDTPSYSPKFESWNSSSLSTSSLRTSDVDKGISFSNLKDGTSQYSRYSSYQYPNTSTSDKVKIQTNSYKKRDPPFGRGPEQFDNVASSIGSLITGAGNDEVKNMPEGRKLEPLQGTREDGKKKKKKKKNAKDDASVATDENGNPIVDTHSLNQVAYKQMRESPTSGSGTVANSHYDSGYGTFPHIDQFGAQPYSSKDAEHESANQKLRHRRKKKDKQEQQTKAEDIANYKGDRPIDEIISFIGGQNETSKKSKKSSTVLEDIPNKAQKSNKKNKDKKQKSPTASSAVVEAEDKGSDSAQQADLDIQDGSEMGNSSVKTVENGDVGVYSKNDKHPKSLNENNVSKTAIIMNSDTTLNNMICKGSVKEKEPSSTNSKRDNIVSGTASDSSKKKSDKVNKTSKVEKNEVLVSKSEETLKIDTNLPNNVTVKHKSTKNKKNKPASPTVKSESDSANIGTSQPTVGDFSPDETLIDDTFMFTDLDVPPVPKEDEFQVVGKKKKKPSKEISHQNHFVPSAGNKPVRRLEDKRAVSSHSNKKTAAPDASTAVMSENDTHVRDLSPSAFPALTTGKGRQSGQEGRRNSTGDVPIPSGLKSQDDSDLESVKSLPATQGSQMDSILSPRLSYAKMAAGPKAPESNASSEKRSSLDSEESDHDHKKSMWKGSPTERRHSIGSSPEMLNKVTGSPASVTASVKAGSQDHILADVVITLEKNKNGPIWDGDKRKVQNTERKDVKVDRNVLSYLPSEKSIPAKVYSDYSPNQSPVSPDSADSVVNSSSQPQQQTSKQHNSYTNDLEMNSSSYSSRNLTSLSNSNLNKQEKSKVKQSNGSNGNKKQKSVIFLDKRVEESTENLGISFGFEIDNLDKIDKIEVSSQMSKDDTSEQKLSSASELSDVDTQAVDNGFELERKNDIKIDFINPSDTFSSHSVISNSLSNSEIDQSNLFERTDQVKTVTTQLVRMNGVINPQGHNSVSSKELSNEDVSLKLAGGGESASSQSTIPDLGLNGVYVYYGESVVTLKKDVVVPSLTNGPTSYCGKIQFVEEANIRSNFNLGEAAAFLRREWDRTLQLQDRDPGEVQFHQD